MDLLLRNSRIKLSQGQVFWREIGSGPILVFLHGFFTDSSQWLSVIEHLNREHHCFAPDLLGFGESERPNIHYSIELEVECLAEFLEALKLREVYLIGHSLGGWIAASYALKYLEQVRGIVLVAPSGVQAEKIGGNERWTRWLLGRPPILFWLLRSLRLPAQFLGFSKKISAALEMRQQLLQSPTTCKLLFQRRPSEIQAELLEERLEWLKVPVLVLQGGQDNNAAIAESKAYAALSPRAALQIINLAGNDLPQQLPDVVAGHIRDFVSGVDF